MKKAALFLIALIFLFCGGTVFAQDKGYDVTSYNATVTLERQQNTIRGNVTMYAKTTGTLSSILQHAKYLTIDSVFVGGQKCGWVWADTSIGAYKVNGFSPIAASKDFSLVTYYHGIGRTEEGSFHWGGVQNDNTMMYAMGVGFSAPYISCTRHWLPCYDLPDDKPDSVTLSFYADTSGIVVSNGIRTAYLVANDGYTTYCRWKIAHPIATYLFTFAFGHLEKLSIANPLNIPFDVYALAQDTAKARLAMSAKVVPALVYFDSLFGSYPFEKVGYVIANLGSMEHQTMITLIRQALDTTGTTPQHELSHMWWGDWVTCKDFNDPWLNEGFATFCESLVLERFKGKAQYIARQKQNINGAINGGSTVPLYGTPMTTHTTSNYPSPILYQKGAAVLGMLRYFIGDEKFFDAIRKYGDRHAYSTATSFDLWHDFEEFTGNDLGWFFKKWVFGIGYPQLGVKWSRDGGNITVFLEQKQDPVTIGYFRLPLTIEVRTKTGNKARTVVQLDSIQSTRTSFTVPFTPDTIVIDPDGLVMKKIIGQVQLGVQDATPSYPQYPPYALRITPNPATQRRIRIEFTREAFVHDTKQHPANFDPFYWVFAVPGASVEFYFFDSAGNKVLQTDTRSPGAHKHLFDCDLSGLSNGSYTVVAVNGSQIMAQGRFTLTK